MTSSPQSENAAPVAVGIGASAGGVEALSLFFDNESGDSGAAFLVVMHLSSSRESHLADILSRHTTMPVSEAAQHQLVEPNEVYVMPPGKAMTVKDGRLQLAQAPQGERMPLVIDRFFNSLAEEYRDHAIGVVLSGTGADGALGLKVVKECGGMTFAQGEDGTVPLFAGMPQSAIAVGAIDLQLSVEEMGPRIGAAVANILAETNAGAAAQPERAEQWRLEIAGLLHAQLNHDFSGYKPSTFLRRVHRRINVLQLDGMEAYVGYLKSTPTEATLLFRDLLISVTSFFRDEEAFKCLEERVIPELFEDHQHGEEIRVWVPGCATGEEAYSLAMLLLERADTIEQDAPEIRVFATDIDERALGIARRGRYPGVLLEAVTHARRERFFTEDRGGWTVTKRLREACTFSPHNVLRDPPFSRVDLVSCRNLLIYMGPDFQDRILPILHYALRPDGFLFVGVAEGATRHGSLFTSVNKSQRIFRRLPVAPGGTSLPQLSAHSKRGSSSPLAVHGGRMSSAGMRRKIETHILQTHTPPYVLVNAQGDALFYSGRTAPFLEFSPGAPSRHLLSNARKELRLGLRRALHDAVASQSRVVMLPVELTVDGSTRRVQMSVEPFGDSAGESAPFLVLFQDLGVAPPRHASSDEESAQTMEQLERELRDTRDQLQSTYEEFETAIEELRVANEELMSVNEELQSSNEELETSKEELQSVNEELQTVATEMTRNVEELDQSNADLRGLLESTDVATIFLDRDLLIRRFTQAATDIFTLIPSDCGRRITDLNHRMADLSLGEWLRETQIRQQSLQRPVTRKDGTRHYLMRVLPYQGASEETGGVVITFIDVTAMAQADAQQRTMIGELNHRVRNMLAVVHALANQTLAPVVDDEVLDPFLSRLHAMARTYKLLTETNWSHMGLRQMLSEELAAACGSARFALSGPEVSLEPREALALGMVIHEMTTNAIKYGALSNDSGLVEVNWTEDPDSDAIDLAWVERGGPAVTVPSSQGFGSLLIKRQLSYELEGHSELDYEPEGLSVRLHLPRLKTPLSEQEQ